MIRATIPTQATLGQSFLSKDELSTKLPGLLCQTPVTRPKSRCVQRSESGRGKPLVQ
jgi:hypothetical protein